MLRAFQIGFQLPDLECVTVGEIGDLLIERSNDDFEYPLKATKDDFQRF